ncbi:unnamed protein product [Peniophora sp. CBMAI 1063]|nr:unnamed protein product [Peniophora sp. CBMAI 1063]
MNFQGLGNNGVVDPWAALGIPPPAAPDAVGGQPQPAPNPLLAQIQNMLNPGLGANPQLAFLAMQLLQGQQPPAQQPQPGPQNLDHHQPPTQLSAQQAKEKVYCDAHSEKVDATLALFISAGQSAGESKFVALENMNARHGHSSDWWKDYYLVHQSRIDALVSSFNGQACSTPTQPLAGPSQSSHPSSSSRTAKRHRSPSTSSSIIDITDEVISTSSGRSRKVSRRIRDHEEASSSTVKSNKTDLAVPSKLPTEPPKSPQPVKYQEGKYRYTPEDETFFVDLILWHAKMSPDANKTDIVRDLAERAPQHSIASWVTFWGMHKASDILERGLRMARVEAAARAVKTEAREWE